MKAYDIIDSEEGLSIGCLLYFEKEKSFIIECQSYLDEWTAPLIFANIVKGGNYTISRELSHLWVNERIIPAGRQNIDSILANAKMTAYDEMPLLEKSGGKCSQDSMYVKKLDHLPAFVKKRMEHNLAECVPCTDHNLLCFFNDKTFRKVSLTELTGNYGVNKILSNEGVFKSGHIAAGGYCITFNDSIDIDARILYESGMEIPLSLDDFIAFTGSNIADTSECCAILECSRQNLTNYLSKDLLNPIKKNVKGNLYTKGNIYRTEILDMLKEDI